MGRPTYESLNQGTKDINDRNVGCKDLHTSPEASAKGTSAKSTGTLVLFESAPHEMQNKLQNSLPLTPRLPIDGKPGKCKQEAANSIVMAECTKGTVGMAEPHKTDVDIDRTALLGREPAERATKQSTTASCSSNKQIFTAKKAVSRTKMQMTIYLKHMDCRLRGSGQYAVQAVRRETREAAQMRQMQCLSACIIQAS